MRVICTAVVSAVFITGCTLGPDYVRPEIESPIDYREQLDQGESLANLSWWEIFQDNELTQLTNLALQQNKDLLIATARVEESRARYGFVRADKFPRVDINASAERGNTGEQLFPGSGIQENYGLSASLAWEIDLFGRLRRLSEAAQAELLATEEARRAIYIALIADVANSYFSLRDLDARLEIAQRTLVVRRDSTNIIRARHNEGIVPLLDVNQAEIEEADAAASVASFERQVAQAENQLSVLLGRSPGPIIRGSRLTEKAVPPSVPAGLPSELLQRRPDIRAAEQSLAAQTARIGAAKALRFPSIGLTGSYGLASNDLSDLLDSDPSIWGIGAGILAPVYNAGQNKRGVEIEVARTDQLLREYESTILQSFREVEDALVAIRTLQDESAAREMQSRAAQSAAMLSRARYDGGVTGYLEVLDSERSSFDAEIAASAVRRARLSAVVELYRALGGGWEPEADGESE